MTHHPLSTFRSLLRPLNWLMMVSAVAALGCASEPDGPELYAQWCSECHGPAGRGDPYRRSLSPGLDLHRSTAIANRSTGWIYRTIRQGYNSMPGFDHELEHNEIQKLVDYSIELVSAPAQR